LTSIIFIFNYGILVTFINKEIDEIPAMTGHTDTV